MIGRRRRISTVISFLTQIRSPEMLPIWVRNRPGNKKLQIYYSGPDMYTIRYILNSYGYIPLTSPGVSAPVLKLS
jgi:hypothetical protein